MILAFDSYYFDKRAKTVAISFDNWGDTCEQKTFSEILHDVAEYKSGEFYKRELPCILSLLNKIETKEIKTIIIDGYVYLDDHGKFGLGAHLFKSLNGQIPVIGIAKTDFHNLNINKRELIRGHSKIPLYISSIGLDLDAAYENIRIMDGQFRIPTLLKKLDTLTKENKNSK